MEPIKSDNRILYLDYLRVYATAAVMILHVSAQNWYSTDVNGFEWQTFNFFDGITVWGVPVFVMLSGALFLNREIPLIKIYSKYILRMVISYAVWSVIYSLFINGTMINRTLAAVKGHYHMWFIPMVIGLYMCVPLVKAIQKNDNTLRYFLALALLFAFVIPEFIILANDFGNELIIKGTNALNSIISNMNVHIVLGHVSYFILGYYINKVTLSKPQRIMIYVMGLFGFAATIVLNLIVALKTQTYCGNYNGNFTINVLFEALAVFVLFKYKNYDNKKRNILIQSASKYSFGAYLIHALVIEQLNIRLGLNTLSFNSAWAVIFISSIVFILSFAMSALLHQIPIVKKYMV